jgi:VanZ family protein
MVSRRWLRPLLWTALAVHWLTIFTLTHLPAKRLPNVKVNDKIEHSLAYFVLSVLLYGALRVNGRKKHLVWIVLLTCTAYGALDEYLQYLLPINRDASVWDWSADVTGTMIGVLICVAFAAASARLRQGRANENLPQQS